MVPVPQECVKEFQEFVLGLSVRAQLTTWPEGLLEKFVSELTPTEAALVTKVAQYTASTGFCPRAELAADMDRSIEEVAEMVQDMANRAWADSLPALVMASPDPRGGTGDCLQRGAVGHHPNPQHARFSLRHSLVLDRLAGRQLEPGWLLGGCW